MAKNWRTRKQKILNYKNWHNHMYCDEYEVEIAVVDKQRKTYLYLNKYEIALDYVKHLGYFIEIEVKNYSQDPIDEYNELLKLAKKLKLNLNNIDKKGYPFHIIYENKK